MLDKDTKDALMQIYLKQGIGAIRPLCEDLGIAAQSIVNYSNSMGFRRTKNNKTSNDKRWERARAIGKVIA